MTIVRRLARPMLAAPLIQNGIDAARHPASRLESARPVLAQVSAPLRLPEDPIQVIRIAGAVSATAGLFLALGRLPRLSALTIVLTAPVVAGNEAPFWTEKDPALRSTKRTAFLRNLGLLGGALLAAVDTEGRPGLAWQGRRAGRAGAQTAMKAAASAQKQAAKAQKRAVKQARRRGATMETALATATGKAKQSLGV